MRPSGSKEGSKQPGKSAEMGMGHDGFKEGMECGRLGCPCPHRFNWGLLDCCGAECGSEPDARSRCEGGSCPFVCRAAGTVCV